MSSLILLAGPIASGKSTVCQSLLCDELSQITYLDAGCVAAGMSRFCAAEAIDEAELVVQRRLRQLSKLSSDIAIEVTLAEPWLVDAVRLLVELGYSLSLIYLWLPSVGLADHRFVTRPYCFTPGRERSQLEHSYHEGLRSLFSYYLGQSQRWVIFDNGGRRPNPLASGGKSQLTIDHQPFVWEELVRRWKK